MGGEGESLALCIGISEETTLSSIDLREVEKTNAVWECVRKK
jgi:hypothetical protein